MQPEVEVMQLGFAHHPSQAEEQPVVVLPGVIDKLGIGNNGAKDGA
jgi:hypothetical protein